MEGLKSVAESSVPLPVVLSVNEAALSPSLCLQVITHVGQPVLHHEAFVQAGKIMGRPSTYCIHTHMRAYAHG